MTHINFILTKEMFLLKIKVIFIPVHNHFSINIGINKFDRSLYILYLECRDNLEILPISL